MDWKDTVMGSQDIKQIKSDRWGEPARNYDYMIEELMVARTQAEITWGKAIREVVEWIEKETTFTSIALDGQVWITKEKWQVQKKIWLK